MRLRRRLATFLTVALLSAPRVVDAQTSAAAEEPPRYPGWVFTPSLGFGGSWDDNVLLINPNNNPPGDYTSPINPSASLDYTGRRTRFSSGYDGSIVLYRTLNELTSFEQAVRAIIEHRVTRRLAIFAQENFTVAPTTDALELSGVPFYRIGSRTNAAGGGLQGAPAKHWLIRSAYSLRSVDFDFDQRSGRELLGGHAHEINASLDRALSPRLTLGGEYEFIRAIVNGERGITARPDDRFNIQSGGMTMQYELGPGLSLSGGFGLAQIGAGLTHEARIGPAWRVGITRRRPHTVLSASYRRSYIPSFGFGGTSQNEEWIGTVSVPFARNRGYVEGSVSWFDNDPLEIGQPSLRSTWISSKTGYRLTPWLRVEGFYTRAQQNTQRAGGKLGRNQIGFQVITSKPFKLH